MSAGGLRPVAGEPPIQVIASVSLLAPAMQRALHAAITQMEAEGLEPQVYETERSHITAVTYYKRGRPPTAEYPHPVTNAPDETYTWHGYGLAADVIHRRLGWDAGAAWFAKMAAIAKQHGLKWGGDWRSPDLPHVQWGKCKASPSAAARQLLRTHGQVGVWLAVDAITTAEAEALGSHLTMKQAA